jgi:hypothetical protein
VRLRQHAVVLPAGREKGTYEMTTPPKDAQSVDGAAVERVAEAIYMAHAAR